MEDLFKDLLEPGMYVDKHIGLCMVGYISVKGILHNDFVRLNLNDELARNNCPTNDEGDE